MRGVGVRITMKDRGEAALLCSPWPLRDRLSSGDARRWGPLCASAAPAGFALDDLRLGGVGGEVACSPPTTTPPAPRRPLLLPLLREGGPGGRVAARIFGGGGERSPAAPVCRGRGPRCRLGIGGSVLGKGETAAPSPRGRAGWGPACWLWLLLHWRMRGGRGAGSGGAGGSPSGWRGGLYE